MACSTVRQPGIVARRRTAGLVQAAGVMTLGLALSPLTAHAAEGADGQTDVKAVVVTGRQHGYGYDDNALSRLPKDLKDIPQSVVVLDKPLLQSEGALSLADALRNVPGITLGGAEGGQIGNNINLNGFTARTDIFLDGFRDRGQYYRDTFALDSVEVLMGPSSMLFGRGSTGGAINQVSKHPLPMPSVEVDLSGTSNGLARGTADVNAPLDDHSAVRIAAMGQQGAVSTRDKTTVDDYGLAPSFSLGMGTPTRLTVSALVQHNHDRPDYGVSPLNGQPVMSGRDTVYGYSTDRTDQDVVAAGAEISHEVNAKLTLRDQLQFNRVTTDAIETAPQGLGTVGAQGYAALSPVGISALPLDQLWARLQSHDRIIHDTSLYDQLEAHAAFNTGPFAQELLAGAEFGHDSYSNQALARTGSCNGVALAAGYVGCVTVLDPAYTASPIVTEAQGNLAGGKADNQAVYFNDVMTVLPKVKLVGGLRYDRFAASITNSVNSANTAGATTFPQLNQTVNFTSSRAGIIWQPARQQTYYFSYSTSFDPSLEQLTSTTGLTQPLPPETNVSYEAGAKWDLLGGKLDLTAAGFQITQDNSRSQNADNTYTANGNIRVRGARLGVAGQITRGWQVFGGYTYLDARIVAAIAPGTLGMTPANTPRHTITAWTTYDIAPHWQLGGGAVYMSSRYLNNADLVSVPGYVRWDATLAYRRMHYEVRLNLFNLLDKHYYDNLIQSDGGRAVPGTGRTAMISLVLRR
jgi:catecholate siderophore receptor